MPDDQTVTRLLIVAELLDKAVEEVRRAMAEVRSDTATATRSSPPPAAEEQP